MNNAIQLDGRFNLVYNTIIKGYTKSSSDIKELNSDCRLGRINIRRIENLFALTGGRNAW
jgi:hypothetical protein